MTPEMTFLRAQSALNLDPLAKNEPSNPRIANNWQGHKVAAIVILGASSLLAAIAATVAALFSLYVVAAVCITACTLLTLSAIVVGQIKVSQKILELINNLTQTITSQFKQIQDLNKKIVLLEEPEEPFIVDVEVPEPIQEVETQEDIKRQIETIMSERDLVQSKLEKELEANHGFQKSMDQATLELSKYREQLQKKMLELEQMQKEKEASQNIPKEQQDENDIKSHELQKTVEQERKRIFELEQELAWHQIQQEEAEEIKKEFARIKEENLIFKEKFAELAQKKDPLNDDDEIKELLPKVKENLQVAARLHRRASLKPSEAKQFFEDYKKQLENELKVQATPQAETEQTKLEAEKNKQEQFDQELQKGSLKEEELKELVQKNQKETVELWRRSLRMKLGEQSLEDIKKLWPAENAKPQVEEPEEDIKKQPVDKVQKEIEKLKIELADTKNQLLEKVDEITELKKQLAAKKIHLENKHIESLQKKIADLEFDLKTNQDLLDKNTLNQKVKNQAQSIKKLETEKKEISKKLESYQEDFVKYDEEFNKMTNKLAEQAKLIKRLKVEKELFENAIEDSRKDVENFKHAHKERPDLFNSDVLHRAIDGILENMKIPGFLEKK